MNRLVKCLILGTLTSLFTGCGPRILDRKTIVTVAIKAYTVARTIENPNAYIIYAKDSRTAQQAADIELNCSKTICAISPAGVIYYVEVPPVDAK